MKILFAFLSCCIILLSVIACSKSKKSLPESSNLITQARKVSGFNQILFNGNGNLIISQGDSESVRLEGEASVIDLMTTLVVDNALRIDYKKASMAQLISTRPPVNVYLQVKAIQEIRLTGSGTITTTTPLDAFNLKVSLSGSGNGTIDITGHKLVTILSGSSNFVVRGTVENQDVWISGSGIYQAEKLDSKVANINITGSGKVSVKVQDDIDIHISGAGAVSYQGNPRIRQKIAGSGSVLRIE